MRILLSMMALILPMLISPLLMAKEMPDQLKAIHVLDRLGFGPRPGDVERVNAMGVENYIHQQLFPETIEEPVELVQAINKLSIYALNPIQLVDKYASQARVESQNRFEIIMSEAAQARLMRAIESPRQLQEVMVDFWFNHFNVYGDKPLVSIFIGDYEREAIRPYVLGHFRDLLEATAKHPAMLIYLDNWFNEYSPTLKDSRAKNSYAMNENYARELMELHTLGIDGGYTQQDVITLSHILTGWGLHRAWGNKGSDYKFYFNEKLHDPGNKVLLGRSIKGGGEDEVEKALDMLANSPATARHISFQLAQYFVSDSPDPVLVDQLVNKFEATDGDIRALLQVIFHSQQFWDINNYQNKFRTPFQYVIAEVRALGKPVANYDPLRWVMGGLGMPFYKCASPQGYQDTKDTWFNSDQLVRRVNWASELSLGWVDFYHDQSPAAYRDLLATVASQLSPLTINEIQKSPEPYRAALILGSPEMMKR